jgi:hypothetical protein
MGETSVVSVRSKSGTKQVMIETKAMSSGTSARKEAKTKTRTRSAPKPPSRDSTSTLDPWLSAPLSSISASMPVSRTGAPATVRPSSARRAAFAASRASPHCEFGSGGGKASAKIVRPSSETNVRSPVETKDAIREPGSVSRRRSSMAASSARTPGESTVLPCGRVTTGSSGGVSPPVPP